MNMRKSIGVLATLLTLTALFSSVTANDDFSEMSPVPTREVLKCMVCKALVDEAEAEIDKVDPRKKVDVGSFRLDGDGNVKQNLVPYARSELHLSEVMDRLCNGGMKDYVLAHYKSSGRPILLRIMTHDGQMNPEMSKVDLTPNPEVSDRLASYCNALVEDFEEEIISMFSKSSKEPHRQLCVTTAAVCPDGAVPDVDQDDSNQSEESYDFEHEEL